jgi:hypothetical protein
MCEGVWDLSGGDEFGPRASVELIIATSGVLGTFKSISKATGLAQGGGF